MSGELFSFDVPPEVLAPVLLVLEEAEVVPVVRSALVVVGMVVETAVEGLVLILVDGVEGLDVLEVLDTLDVLGVLMATLEVLAALAVLEEVLEVLDVLEELSEVMVAAAAAVEPGADTGTAPKVGRDTSPETSH